ncbi:hypothetical protein J8824_26695, partial [Klebsiella pneumoniae]
MGEISVKTGNNARNGGKNSLNRLIRCVCGKKIGPDPRNFNQRVSLGRNDLLIRTFPVIGGGTLATVSTYTLSCLMSAALELPRCCIVIANLSGSYVAQTKAIAEATLKPHQEAMTPTRRSTTEQSDATALVMYRHLRPPCAIRFCGDWCVEPT